jgi:hypothetical protein
MIAYVTQFRKIAFKTYLQEEALLDIRVNCIIHDIVILNEIMMKWFLINVGRMLQCLLV